MKPPWGTILAVVLVVAGLLAFFSRVNLTQRQAVITLFAAVAAGLAYWFWKKPWK